MWFGPLCATAFPPYAMNLKLTSGSPTLILLLLCMSVCSTVSYLLEVGSVLRPICSGIILIFNSSRNNVAIYWIWLSSCLQMRFFFLPWLLHIFIVWLYLTSIIRTNQLFSFHIIKLPELLLFTVIIYLIVFKINRPIIHLLTVDVGLSTSSHGKLVWSLFRLFLSGVSAL